MTSIKSKECNSIISLDYDDFNNKVEIHIGNDTGFRFINLDYNQCELLIEKINDLKNQII